MFQSTKRLRIASAALCVGLLAAACGSDGDKDADGDRVSPPTNSAQTQSESATATASTAPTTPTRCDWGLNTVAYWKQNPPATPNAHGHMGDSQGNHHGMQSWKPITNTEACDELAAQVDTMEAVASEYPTAQDALDAGCFRATIYVPGIAAHYYCLKDSNAGTDIERPTMLLYGGSQPTAPMVGLSYMVYETEAPDTVADSPLWAKYMPWHFHEGLCIRGGQVIGGDNSNKERCQAAGGAIQGKTGWMGHYWLASCPSPDGVFSAANPRLDIGVAVYNDEPANAVKTTQIVNQPCRGTEVKIERSGDDRFGPPPNADTPAATDHDMGDMEHGEHGHDG